MQLYSNIFININSESVSALLILYLYIEHFKSELCRVKPQMTTAKLAMANLNTVQLHNFSPFFHPTPMPEFPSLSTILSPVASSPLYPPSCPQWLSCSLSWISRSESTLYLVSVRYRCTLFGTRLLKKAELSHY